MAFIAFLGCDGSGKSSVINGVTAALLGEGQEVTQGHWRPKTFAGRTSNLTEVVEDPHGMPPRGVVASLAKLLWIWLNWWVGWFGGLNGKSRSGFLIFDRYHRDLLVDPLRYRYGGPMGFARFLCRQLPQPDLVLFLDAPAEVLLSRKQEVPLETLKASRCGYLDLAMADERIEIVDASLPLEEVVTNVLAKIWAVQNRPHR